MFDIVFYAKVHMKAECTRADREFIRDSKSRQ